MNEWGVVIVIISLVGLIISFINPTVKTTKVIQQNTDAINNLTKEINSLTTNNQKDHDHFFKEINSLNKHVALLQEKHKGDN